MLYLVEIFLTLLMNHLQKQNLPLNLHLPPLFPPPLRSHSLMMFRSLSTRRNS